MPIFKFNAHVTVSAYTEVEAATEKEAWAIVEEREVAQMVSQALFPGDDEAWHIESDGEPENIRLDSTPD